MGNGFLVFLVVLSFIHFAAADIFMIGHNYSCIYEKYTVMECIPGSEIQPVVFQAPDLVEPVGTNNWWLNFGIIIALVLFSGMLLSGDMKRG